MPEPEYPRDGCYCFACDNARGRAAASTVSKRPGKYVTVTLEAQTSLTDAVKAAEESLNMAGAYTITSCSVAGNDEDGWYVTVEGKA